VAERALQADHRVAGLEQLLTGIGVDDERRGDRVGARAGRFEAADQVAQLVAALLDHLGEPVAQPDQPAAMIVGVLQIVGRVVERVGLDHP